MKIRTIFLIGLFLLGNFACFADLYRMPTSDALAYSVRIDGASNIEIQSGLSFSSKNPRGLYILEFESVLTKEGFQPKVLNLSLSGSKFIVPRSLFKDVGAVYATPLFKLDGTDIGFMLYCGDAEYSFRRVFKIDLINGTIRYYDFSLAGDLIRIGKEVRLIKR